LVLKAFLSDEASHRSKEWFEEQFRRLWFEPYAPVRTQLLSLVRAVNRRRELACFEPISPSCVRVRRRVVRPFAPQVLAAPDQPSGLMVA
jgi:hypothetical protein